MGIQNFHSCINKLTQANLGIQKKIENKEADFDKLFNVTENQLEVITNILHNTSDHRHQQRTRLRALHTLEDLDLAITQCEVEPTKIQSLRKKILEIKTELESIPTPKKPILTNTKIDLQIAMMCDIDAADHNGAIVSGLISFLKEELPVVTTRSLLSCSAIEVKSEKVSSIRKIKTCLFEAQKKYDIYQQCDPNFGEEMILFLPKNLSPELTTEERFKKLGLTVSGTLKPISAGEALHRPEGKGNLEAFFNMFSQDSISSKLFHISGHGGSGRAIGALNPDNFQKLLAFLEQQQCRGLSIVSCYAGGKNSLMYRPKEGEKHTYPTIVNSIGEFCTNVSDNPTLVFKEIKHFLENDKQIATVDKYASMVAKAKKNYEVEYNAAKVYLPHSADSPLGFYSLGELFTGTAVTFRTLQAAKISKKNDIPLSPGKFIKIHPLITDITLKCQGINPLLISMLAGNGQHYIKELSLVNEAPLDYLKRTIQSQKNQKPEGDTCFFINKLTGQNKISGQEIGMSNLIFRTGNFNYCVWKENDKCYFCESDANPVEITPKVYDLIAFDVHEDSKPSLEAVRIASGSQESPEMLDTVLRNKGFISFSTLQEFKELKDIIKIPTKEGFSSIGLISSKPKTETPESLDVTENKRETLDDLKAIAEGSILTAEITPQEQEKLLFFLLDHKQPQIALELFKSKNIDPNVKSLHGTSLLVYALARGHYDFVKYLLELPTINVGATDSAGTSALHAAVRAKNIELTKLLLEKHANVKNTDEHGWSPLYFGLHPFNQEICKVLLQSGADINEHNTKGSTLLINLLKCEKDYAQEDNISEILDFLLKNGANPTLGKPSALTLALINNSYNLAEKLIQQGGNPFSVQPDDGAIPFIEALKYASTETIKKLLNSEQCNFQVIDNQGVTPLIAAYYLGNQEIIDLIATKAPLSSHYLSTPCLELLYDVLERLILSDDQKAIHSLFLNDGPFAPHLSDIMGCNLHLGEIPTPILQFVLDNIRENRLDYNKKFINGNNYLAEICLKAQDNFSAEYQEIIALLLDKDADLAMYAGDQRILFTDQEIIDFMFKKSNLFAQKHLEEWLLSLLNRGHLDKMQQVMADYLAPDQKPQMLAKIADFITNRAFLKSEKFLWLLEQGAALDDPGSLNSKLSILGSIIRYGTLEDIKLLVEQKKTLTHRNASMLTPLEAAAMRRDSVSVDFLQYLVNAGESLDAPANGKFATPFAFLARYGDMKSLEWAIAQGADLSSIQGDKMTAVQAAAQDSSDKTKEKLKKLIAMGADINLCNSKGKPAIISIIKQGDLDLMNWSLEQGAHLDTPELKSQALTAAVASGNTSLLKKFMKMGFTLLPQHLAQAGWIVKGYQKGKNAMLLKALQFIPDCSNLENSIKEGLSKEIANQKDYISAKMLLEKSLWVPASSGGLNSIIEMALTENKKDLLELINDRNLLDFTAISGRAFSTLLRKDTNCETLNWLLNHDLDLHSKLADGQTLLTAAIDVENIEAVKLLLEKNIDPHLIPSNSTMTPLYQAVVKNNIEFIKLLLDKDCAKDLYVKTDRGLSAVDLAIRKQSTSILDLLRERNLF